MPPDLQGGARLMVGFHGLNPSRRFVDFVQSEGVQSIIMFARNLRSAQQAQDLICELRSLVDWDLLIAVDQEGGAVTRLSQGVTTFPGNRALGVAASASLAREQGRESGRQLAGIGFDLNLAPVVDVNTLSDNAGIGIRSFGDDAEQVIGLAEALVIGHAECGVHSCLKHFPGKGASQLDAHFDLPVIGLSSSEILSVHVEPFRRLVKSASAVMSSHIVVSALDSEQPATFSSLISRDLLRRELGFDGLLIADDLEMGALARLATVPESAVRSAEAGHDLLPISHDIDLQMGAARALTGALRSGRLPSEEHHRSLHRIQTLVRRSERPPLASTEAGDAVATLIADASVTKIQDPNALCPIDSQMPIHLIAMVPDDFKGVFEPGDDDWITVIHRLMDERTPSTVCCSRLAVDGAMVGPKIDGDSLLVCLTWNLRSASRPARDAMLAVINAESARSVVVHVRDPFDQELLGDTVTAYTTNGFRNCQLKAVVNELIQPSA